MANWLAYQFQRPCLRRASSESCITCNNLCGLCVSAVIPMDVKALDRECVVFCRYLIGQEPSEYVKRKYREAHQSRSFNHGEHSDPADGLLVKIARIHPWSTNIIDAYTRVFRPFSTVRKKLVLLLAVLETCAPTHAYLDSLDSASVPLLCLRLVQRCLTFALIVIVSALVILPADLVLRGSARRRLLWQLRNG